MIDWYDMDRTSQIRHQARLAEADTHRLALWNKAPQTGSVGSLRIWLAQVLRASAQRLDRQFDAPRYETSGEKAY